MGGISEIDQNDWVLSFPLNDDNVRTIVLVGRTGNGKSSTGNTILGKTAFLSKRSSGGVTNTCELGNSVLENGRILNVIDTPGLFDASVEFEVIRNEIVKCVEMAKDGIHAVLVVLSVKTRFSREEESVIKSLREIFGTDISEYMIVVFTSGDELREDDVTLDDYLSNCPETLKEMLKLCGDRCVLFDNRTKDESKKSEQLNQLLSLVDVVVDNKGGKPFTNELFVEMKKGAYKMYEDLIAEIDSSKLESSKEQSIKKAYEEQLQSTAVMVESLLKENTYLLEKQLVEEQVTRLKLEIAAKDSQMLSDKDHEARLKLEKAAKEAKEQSDKERAARVKLETAAKESKEQSDKERAARLKSEKAANEAKEQSDKEHAAREKDMRELREKLVKAEKDIAALKKKSEEGCSIL